jgi:hypothetical protein
MIVWQERVVASAELPRPVSSTSAHPHPISQRCELGFVSVNYPPQVVSVTPTFTFAFYKDRRHQCLRKLPFLERHLAAEPPSYASPIIRISVLFPPSFPSLASTACSDNFHRRARWLTSLLSRSPSTMSRLPVGNTSSLPTTLCRNLSTYPTSP